MLLPLLAAGTAIGWAIWHYQVGPEQRRRQRDAQLLAMSRKSMATLIDDAKAAVLMERWQRFPSGQRVLAIDATSSGAMLAAALDELTTEACQEDIAQGRSFGRDTNYFEIYDCGIVGIIEELGRRGFPRPSKKPVDAW